MPFKAGLRVLSADPEVMALQAIIKGVRHFEAKNLTSLHLAVMSAVEVCKKEFKVTPTLDQIASMMGMEAQELEPTVEGLVDLRYLVTKHNTFGPLKLTYTLGPAGGTALRSMLSRTKKKS